MSSEYDLSQLFRIDGLVCVVTGGGTGLGLVIANALDANGAKAVYIVGRREEKLQQAAKAAKNGSLIPVVGDVTSPESLKAIADRIKAEHGYLNAVLANAGITGYAEPKLMPGVLVAPRSQIDLPVDEFVQSYWKAGPEIFANDLNINTTAVFFTALAFMELLVAGNERGNVSQKSQIVVTTSLAAFVRTHPGFSYAASKAATTHLCKSLTTILAPYSIRVNNLAPGFFPSDMSSPFSDWLAGEGVDATKEGTITKDLVPAGRFGSNQELAGTVLYLLSRAGGYMNGAILIPDGGLLSQIPSTY